MKDKSQYREKASLHVSFKLTKKAEIQFVVDYMERWDCEVPTAAMLRMFRQERKRYEVLEDRAALTAALREAIIGNFVPIFRACQRGLIDPFEAHARLKLGYVDSSQPLPHEDQVSAALLRGMSHDDYAETLDKLADEIKERDEDPDRPLPLASRVPPRGGEAPPDVPSFPALGNEEEP